MSEESMLSGQATTDTGVQQPTDAASSLFTNTNAQPPAEQAAQQPADAPEVEESQPEGAPEAYDFKLPEGFELNAEIGAELGEWAKGLNLPQDQAQKAVDMGAKLVEQTLAKQVEAYQAQVADWRNQVETDKEIGGPALGENLSYAARAIDTFAPELRAVFDETGLGNHPALVKAFIRIGKAVSEDRLVGGAQQSAGASLDPAARLFPTMN